MKATQYTIRNIPSGLDAKLRARAKREKKSLNRLVIEQLNRSVSNNSVATGHHDYDHYVNTWVDDPGFDEAMKDMRVVDPRDWQ
jgi:hypothetical protein